MRNLYSTPIPGAVRGLAMFELMTAFIAAFSASIFLAHTVEAYLAQ
jgi:hypothetical protein